MKRLSLGVLLLVLALGVFGVVAQEATPTVDPAMVATVDPNIQEAGAGGIDLEGLTNDPSVYLGQTVRLEGVVEDLLNVRAFVLSEGAALDNDQVLVINNSGQEFDVRLTPGARFLIEGTVYPSFADGGLTQVVANTPQMAEATQDAMNAEATPEAAPGMAYTTSLASMVLPDELFNHTIIVIDQIEDIALIGLPE